MLFAKTQSDTRVKCVSAKTYKQITCIFKFSASLGWIRPIDYCQHEFTIPVEIKCSKYIHFLFLTHQQNSVRELYLSSRCSANTVTGPPRMSVNVTVCPYINNQNYLLPSGWYGGLQLKCKCHKHGSQCGTSILYHTYHSSCLS